MVSKEINGQTRLSDIKCQRSSTTTPLQWPRARRSSVGNGGKIKSTSPLTIVWEIFLKSYKDPLHFRLFNCVVSCGPFIWDKVFSALPPWSITGVSAVGLVER